MQVLLQFSCTAWHIPPLGASAIKLPQGNSGSHYAL